MKYFRHDLVIGKLEREAFDSLNTDFKELILKNKIPGIVRREESISSKELQNFYTKKELVHVGFVYPHKIDGNRLRFASSIRGDDISKKISPFDIPRYVYEKRSAPLQALDEIYSAYKNIGVWGSACLEIATGFHYTNETSDLDIMTLYKGHEDLVDLWKMINEFESIHRTRIDVEVILPSYYGINLKEYMMGGDTLLAKGLRDVILINREDIEQIHEQGRDTQ